LRKRTKLAVTILPIVTVLTLFLIFFVHARLHPWSIEFDYEDHTMKGLLHHDVYNVYKFNDGKHQIFAGIDIGPSMHDPLVSLTLFGKVPANIYINEKRNDTIWLVYSLPMNSEHVILGYKTIYNSTKTIQFLLSSNMDYLYHQGFVSNSTNYKQAIDILTKFQGPLIRYYYESHM
jgi:hypothetical protein